MLAQAARERHFGSTGIMAAKGAATVTANRRSQSHRVPTPPHPVNRHEPLPWHCPKPPEEDPEAPARVEAIVRSPGYRRADLDLDFLASDSMRGVRL